MREIEFRGKRIDNKKWIYGDLVRIEEKVCMFDYDFGDTGISNSQIFSPIFIEVIPETVGQYVGIKDKHEKKGYFGDLVKYPTTGIFEVRWIEAFGEAKLVSMKNPNILGNISSIDSGEIIGNIYEGGINDKE